MADWSTTSLLQTQNKWSRIYKNTQVRHFILIKDKTPRSTWGPGGLPWDRRCGQNESYNENYSTRHLKDCSNFRIIQYFILVSICGSSTQCASFLYMTGGSIALSIHMGCQFSVAGQFIVQAYIVYTCKVFSPVLCRTVVSHEDTKSQYLNWVTCIGPCS